MRTHSYIWYGGVCAGIIVLAATWYLLNFNSKEATAIPPESIEHLSAFEKGQYYFNADEDTDGPYDLALAREYFTQAIIENPRGNELAWYQLGRIDFLEGKFDAAIFKFNKQIEYFDDAVPNVYYMIGLVYGYKARATGDMEDWERASEGFATFVPYTPGAPWPRVDLAWTYFSQGKYAEMEPVIKEGLEYRPNNPWLLNMYGLTMLHTDRKDEAGEYFERALAEAEQLTEEEWGHAYSGNDPNSWQYGLESFRDAIRANLEIARSSEN